MKRVLIGGLAMIAATTLTACGSSSNSPSASSSSPSSPSTPSSSSPAITGGSSATVAAAIKAELLASESSSATNPYKMNDAQATCTANAIVNGFGVDRLRTYGLINAENKVTGTKFSAVHLSTADATVVVNGIFNCVGDSVYATEVRNAVEAGFASHATSAQKACLESKLSVAAIKQVVIAELTGQTAAATQFATSIESCMVS